MKSIYDMTAAERLELAREMRRTLAGPVQWTKDAYAEEADGRRRFCTIGAGVVAYMKLNGLGTPGLTGNQWGAYESDVARLIHEATGISDAIGWNDHPERAWAEVDELLNKVVRHYEVEAAAAAAASA